MARYNRFMGEYNENTPYEKGDVVTFDGAAYYRKMPGSGISPIARKKPYTVWSRLNEALSTIFPLGGGGGSGTGLPSDVGAYKYMATDGNGEWLAADRLAWKEEKSTTLFDGVPELIGSSYGFGAYQVGEKEPNNITLNLSSTYTIVFDGVTYSDVQPTLDSEDNGPIRLAIIQDDMPVVVIRDNSFAEANPADYLIMDAPGTEEHTLVLIEHTENVHKVSPELLPEGIGYKTPEEKQILPETEVPISSQIGEGIFSGEFPTVVELVDGAEYTVIFNGTSYNVTGVSRALDGLEGVFVGNWGLTTGVDQDNTGEPFVIAYASEVGLVLFTTESEKCTVAIYGVVETIHPIPAEYLPKTTVIFSPVYETDGITETGEYVCSHTFEEVKALYQNNGFVNAIYKYKSEDSYNLISEHSAFIPWFSAFTPEGEIVGLSFYGSTRNEDAWIEIGYQEGTLTVNIN